MHKTLNKNIMLKSLQKLDQKLPCPCLLIIGGGGALVLSNDFPLATYDIDALPKGISIDELNIFVLQVARELNLPNDWLNPYFASFTHVLPLDFETRLKTVFEGSKLTAQALGKEDLLIMKCFAHRQKDIPHARALVKKGATLAIVDKQMAFLKKNKAHGVEQAVEFLDMILELEDV